MPIRLATSYDAQIIKDLHTASVTQLCNQYTPEMIAVWLEDRSPEGYMRGISRKEMYVYENQGKILGFSHVVPGEIVALFVSPESARKGVGSALIKHAMPYSRSNWEGSVRLEATLNSVPFYQTIGFKKIGESVTRRNNVEILTIIMEADEI